MLQIRDKVLDFFKDLYFEEEKHKYFVSGTPIKSSVSKILKVFVEAVDFDLIAHFIDKRDKLTSGVTKKRWDLNSKISLAIGISSHYFGELYAFNKNIKPTSGYEEAVVKFWDSLPKHILPFEMELQMYHKEYMFAGTADILLYNTKTGKFILCDFKTNKDLFKNYKGKKMMGEFRDLPDTPLNHYQLQLSFYQILFEQTGFKVENRAVISLRPDGEFKMYSTEDYTKVLVEYLKNNKV